MSATSLTDVIASGSSLETEAFKPQETKNISKLGLFVCSVVLCVCVCGGLFCEVFCFGLVIFLFHSPPLFFPWKLKSECDALSIKCCWMETQTHHTGQAFEEMRAFLMCLVARVSLRE